MTSINVRAWRQRLCLTQAQAAEELNRPTTQEPTMSESKDEQISDTLARERDSWKKYANQNWKAYERAEEERQHHARLSYQYMKEAEAAEAERDEAIAERDEQKRRADALERATEAVQDRLPDIENELQRWLMGEAINMAEINEAVNYIRASLNDHPGLAEHPETLEQQGYKARGEPLADQPKGLYAQLTPEQRDAIKNYNGPVNSGSADHPATGEAGSLNADTGAHRECAGSVSCAEQATPNPTAVEAVHRPVIEDEVWEGDPLYEDFPVEIKVRGAWFIREDNSAAGMKVKLTTRDSTEAMQSAGVSDIQDFGLGDADEVFADMHDAAPDDATKALEELVDEVVTVRENGVDLKHLFETLDRLRTTPEGAALIRQAEDCDDGSV